MPDVIGPRLAVLFVGINPSLYSGAVGHHFARPGNRFWPVLHASGFTAELLSPYDERELLTRRIGITNLVNRATASADELTADELRRGGTRIAASNLAALSDGAKIHVVTQEAGQGEGS